MLHSRGLDAAAQSSCACHAPLQHDAGSTDGWDSLKYDPTILNRSAVENWMACRAGGMADRLRWAGRGACCRCLQHLPPSLGLPLHAAHPLWLGSPCPAAETMRAQQLPCPPLPCLEYRGLVALLQQDHVGLRVVHRAEQGNQVGAQPAGGGDGGQVVHMGLKNWRGGSLAPITDAPPSGAASVRHAQRSRPLAAAGQQLGPRRRRALTWRR